MRALAAVMVVAWAGMGCTTVRGIPEPGTITADGKASKLEGDGMLAYRVATEIAAPPAAVFAILLDGPGYTAWNSTLVSFSGKVAQGETVHLVSKLDPSRTFDLKVSKVGPGETLVWEDGMPMGLFAGVRTYEVTPLEGGRSKFVMAEVFSGPMLRMIAGSLPDMRANFETIAADLKRKAEASAPPAAAPAAPAAPAEAAPAPAAPAP